MLNAVVHAANTHRLRHAHAHIHQQTIMRGQEAVTWSMSPALFDSALLTWTTDLNHSWSTFFFFFLPLPRTLAGVRQSTGATLQNTACVMKRMGGEASERAGTGWKIGLGWGDRMDVRCGRGEGSLFSEATERHLIFPSRPLHQGDLQRSRERETERGGERALRWL